MGDLQEAVRQKELLAAQDKANELFQAVTQNDIIRAGVSEIDASDAIRDMAADMFGVSRYWHKRIVRAGENTLMPYKRKPPVRMIEEDDIAFADFGPVFEGWEADFGRTFVVGGNPAKKRLRDVLPDLFQQSRAYFESQPDITGEQLYDKVIELTHAAGYKYGGPYCGHLVGEYPHERIAGDEIENYIATQNTLPMRRNDRNGQQCHWILEIHIVDEDQKIGGFYEELLDL